MKNKLLSTAFGLLFSCFAISAQAKLMITNEVVRALPPSVPNTAAYLDIMNHSERPISLIGVTTKVAEKAELHTLAEQDGVIKMTQVDHIFIRPMARVELSPGGFHIMLIGLTSPLKLGAKVPMTLSFDDGSTRDIEAVVTDLNDASASHEHHHHNH
ncbi:copper chaperone PCu(A)C [Paraferrimonas haliotis]|uniref:Copper chaperone PCu(A)C n=1 Tax=Paraferrimonas haliotis TaxID=2013866 RepID=A0AA37TN06_9GAMM|nr:copper chaperone PCu(A)C [Paraferrimonas haliotis]GLS82470.1 hypothetical protein GCM10007894_04470 [Paraferrimonas haliotis]